MLHERLKALKDTKKMTVKEISLKSGIPESTVSRILSGQTENPSFANICDIVVAMDGSLDELVGIKLNIDKTNYDLLYEKIIELKNKWILRLFIFACLMVAILIFLILFDLFNPSSGYILK